MRKREKWEIKKNEKKFRSRIFEASKLRFFRFLFVHFEEERIVMVI